MIKPSNLAGLEATVNFQRSAGHPLVLSRINGESDVASIINICPISENQTLLILARLLKQGMIEPV